MLQSFTGTVDRNGIRSLEVESDSGPRRIEDRDLAEFWAVLDSADLESIQLAIHSGQRRHALRMVSERAQSMGSM